MAAIVWRPELQNSRRLPKQCLSASEVIFYRKNSAKKSSELFLWLLSGGRLNFSQNLETIFGEKNLSQVVSVKCGHRHSP